MTKKMQRGKVCIRESLYTGKNQDQYIKTDTSPAFLIMSKKGRYSPVS